MVRENSVNNRERNSNQNTIMKLNKFTSYLALIGLGVGAAISPSLRAQQPEPADTHGIKSGSAGPVITDPAEAIEIDFDDFDHSSTVNAAGSTLATLPTLPGGFYLLGTPKSSNLRYRGLSAGTEGSVPAGGFYSYGNDPDERSLGVLEGATSELRESRIGFKFENDTSANIDRILVKYDLELWRDGERRNRLRLRYSDVQSPLIEDEDNDDWSDIQLDVGAVVNNESDATANGVSATGTALILLNDSGDHRSALADGDVGWLRWQYSSTSGEDSGTRDGLGLDNVVVQALKSGTDYVWTGATEDIWSTSAAEWNIGTQVVWDNTDKNAKFNGSGQTPVNLASAGATAVDLIVEANPSNFGTLGDYTIEPESGDPVLTLEGIVNNAVNVNVDVKLDVDDTQVPGLYKIGAGTLNLGAASNPFAGGLNILDGEVQLGIDGALNTTTPNLVNVSAGASLLVGDHTATVGGLTSVVGGTVELKPGSGGTKTFTINVADGLQALHRGALSGYADKVVKTGPGLQKFQTSTKTYYAKTLVEDGVLQLTENSGLPNTSEIKVTSGSGMQGEFYLYSDSTSNEDFSYPQSITLEGGYLRAETEGGATLLSGVALGAGDNRIYSSGGATHEFHIDGVISGTGDLRKQGTGFLYLNNASNTYTGETNINNGTIVVPATGSLGSGKLWLTDPDENRRLVLEAPTMGTKVVTVAGLEGNSPDLELELEQSGFIEVPDGVEFEIDQVASVDGEDEEIKPSYQGDFEGDGLIVKKGNGTTRLTRYVKTFEGDFIVEEGVLQVSADGQPTSAVSITVEQGGQLRLSSGVDDIGDIADATYNFGTPVVLKSTQREVSGVVVYPEEGFGVLGGLRFDPDTGIQYGALVSGIQVDAASDIHINGVDKVLTFSGALTGSAALSRTGGGTWVIEGDASGYTGVLTLSNGTTELSAAQVFGGSVVVNADELVVEADAEIQGDLTVANAAVIAYTADPNNIIIVGNDAALAAGAVIDFQGTGVPGTTYTVIVAGNSVSLGGAISVVNTPTAATVNNTGTDLEIQLAP
ncbi:autotransporter-associated beta strand repeat-containing protein [Phragmitibacter flavus]|nr:autotransporter-associated beta strand repeat-containing protein [Phragmitibacter flavus]